MSREYHALKSQACNRQGQTTITVLRKIAAASKKVSRKHMLQYAEQLYGQFFLDETLMWLGYVARNHFKAIVFAVLVAA
jgi:hypothetical protein